MQGESQPEPLGKVAGHVLGQPYNWLYLVEDAEAGLAWVAATQMHEDMAQKVIEQGGWVDHPEKVPTLIVT